MHQLDQTCQNAWICVLWNAVSKVENMGRWGLTLTNNLTPLCFKNVEWGGQVGGIQIALQGNSIVKKRGC